MNIFDDILPTDNLNAVKKNIYVSLKRSMHKFHDNMPKSASENGVYGYDSKFYDDWHGGFWTGLYYMAYEMFGDKTFFNYADSITKKFEQKTINHTIWESSDEGLIYIPLCVNNFRYNHRRNTLETLYIAAERMMKSFHDDNGIINIGMSKAADLVNLNLLRIVSKISNDKKYLHVAQEYEKIIFKNNIADDGTCVMKVFFDKEDTGRAATGGTCDIRACAWLLLGVAQRYANTGEDKYLQKFDIILKKYVSVFWGNILSQTDSINKSTDTTSMNICDCAIMELLKKLEPSSVLFSKYMNVLKYNINCIVSDYLVGCDKNSQGLVGGGYHTVDNKRLRGSVIMGDYFFMESLMHCNSKFCSCWDVDNFCKYIN